MLKLIIVLAVLGGGGFWAYKTFVQKEEVKVPDIDIKLDVEVDPWVKAEGYYHSFQYEKAVGAYREVIAQKKDPAKVEESHFRIANSYNKSKMAKEAIGAYEAALKKYPMSAHAERAKQSLEKLRLEQGR